MLHAGSAVYRHVRPGCEAGLAPVPFSQNVATPAVIPAVRYPAGTRPWWQFPPPCVPGVGIAIPTVVPGNPHMVGAGGRPPRFDYSRGWRDAHHNFGHRGAESQPACKNQTDQSLINHNNSPFLTVHVIQEHVHSPSQSEMGQEPAKPLGRSLAVASVEESQHVGYEQNQ